VTAPFLVNPGKYPGYWLQARGIEVGLCGYIAMCMERRTEEERLSGRKGEYLLG